jgi:integrating conjugative element protein (TIGR03759 family)
MRTTTGMSSRFLFTALGLVLAISVPVYAGNVASTLTTETGKETSTSKTSVLSDSERARARTWNLSEMEWRRYRELMQGIRGSISPETISPIEVLGIHARDEAERQRFAEAWARAMREDVDRILAFQHAYDAAGKRLYPNEPLIDIDRLPVKPEETSVLQSTDRLLFFARPECPACDMLVGKLLKRIDDVSGIDIYLLGLAPGDDVAVRDWASAHQIDPEWVRGRRITLNHDGDALDRLTSGQGEAPYILRRRGADVSQLRVLDL